MALKNTIPKWILILSTELLLKNTPPAPRVAGGAKTVSTACYRIDFKQVFLAFFEIVTQCRVKRKPAEAGSQDS